MHDESEQASSLLDLPEAETATRPPSGLERDECRMINGRGLPA